ncbi:MAG: peptide ABC transporter permease [Acidobacteria bacterium]|jgi:peptide/nickel transport system permease protein|nr:peptide ABC transporter permease [Acidobacteriota bacterium]|tara:strand:+ start:2701 stop:3606 length:906 start_codon:yes stop_codon:yes gene_type:complete
MTQVPEPSSKRPADSQFVVRRVYVSKEQSLPRRWLSFMRANPLFTIGLILLTMFVGLATIGPFFVGDPLRTNITERFSPPSAEHWFGTDVFGRDVFARTVHAARLDLSIGLTIAFVAMVIGSTVGVISGYFGGWVDEIIMRLTDVLLAFPGFVLALIIVAALDESLLNVVIAVAAAYVPYFIRLTRAQALVEREQEYADAAQLAGNSPFRVAFRHVMPNSLQPALVSATLVTGWAVLTVAGLAFLSVGIQPPKAEWGVMVGEGARDIITGEWWTSLFPGGMVVLAVMAFHFIGDDLTEARA